MAAKKRGESALGGKKKSGSKKHKSGRKPHEMRIRRAKGGYVVEHHHKGEDGMPDMPSMEEHTVPDLASLQQHVGEHMGPDEAAAPGGPAAMPPGGGGGAGGGMMGM